MQRNRHTIDAEGKILGRLATHIATLLIGKHKPSHEGHIDDGDVVQVVNAAKVKVTGQKMTQKELIHHSWHPGGIKRIPLKRVFEKNPTEVLRHAVSKMLPRNKQRKDRMARLKIEA